VLEEQGKTRYWLAKETDITEPAIYRLAEPGRAVTRIDARTLEKLCRALGVGIGDILELVPDREGKRARRAADD
jgi:DNA-binding Xre family transcriptional regulator